MDAFMYQYKCSGTWYGFHTGVRNFHIPDEDDVNVMSLIKKDVENTLGFKNCDINLLVKYKLSIESVKTYPQITKIPFTEKVKKNNLELD